MLTPNGMTGCPAGLDKKPDYRVLTVTRLCKVRSKLYGNIISL
ncbi:Uncharacterized protein dnm_044880 [Desulfonema magnum]|uniref:Uncharacterized protein n=1 Tax=Desulfonema magnum TaxID=45655 RepID=A0A975BND7_9BACT|nr:Uncharacterized protein dnm_044880 [Desulfonema magnum]